MPAGTAAMLVGLQPIVTVFLARAWLGERVVARQWLGLLLGIGGVWLVVRHKVSLDADLGALAAIFTALFAISVGTLWQKRHASHVDLRTGAVIQFTACALAYLPLVLIFERDGEVQWTREFAFAIGWSVVVLSVGAISLLYHLLRHGAASGVASLFYLVPPVTALMAWMLFGERLDAGALVGLAVIVVAVALARPPAPRPASVTS
jgi:drug/metabolite transporter (DMT)-like permease